MRFMTNISYWRFKVKIKASTEFCRYSAGILLMRLLLGFICENRLQVILIDKIHYQIYYY